MTRIVASAPGKLVLLGEYAVLEGAPALVLAVDHRATAKLVAHRDDAWEIVSPTLDMQARFRFDGNAPRWLGSAPAELEWIATLLARFPPARHLPPCRIELDSAAFHVDHGDARVKLGLGSSAALSVALLGALHAAGGLPPPTLAACIAAHRAIQHGHGSGIDIGAALGGGLTVFQLEGDTPRVNPAQLPARLHWCCVYSGRPASTRDLLVQVARWRAHAPGAFAQHIHELATISSRGIDAIAANDADAFLSCLHEYAQALAAFGEAAGADIASREHRALGALAASRGCVYKSCGAGGGDVGITFAVEDGRVRDFAARAAADGFRVIGLREDRRGLDIVTDV